MSKRNKKRNRKVTAPFLQDRGPSDETQSAVPDVKSRAVSGGSGSMPVVNASAQGHAGIADRALKWFAPIKTGRELVVAAAAVAALVISIGSWRTAKDSLALSNQQAEANRRYHQNHVKPDVRAVIRHSSSGSYKNSSMSAELVAWNNGPIKAVSLTGSYRVYIPNPTNWHIVASMGISEPLVDYSFSLPELKPSGEFTKQILSAGSPALYVVNLAFFRETDMERYSVEDYFLFENDTFYDRESLRTRTNYNIIMDNLLLKMKCEIQAGINRYRVVDPPQSGSSHLNFDVLNVPEPDSSEWELIISNRTSEISSDPGNPAGYVARLETGIPAWPIAITNPHPKDFSCPSIPHKRHVPVLYPRTCKKS